MVLCIIGIAKISNAQQQVSKEEARQDTTHSVSAFKHHSIYAEFFGSSTFYSVNYDYLFRIYKDNIKLAVGAGTGCFSYTYLYDDVGGLKKMRSTWLYFTPEINFLFGKKNHYFETGTAFMNVIVSKEFLFAPGGRIGYRYQPQKGGFLFRIAYTPIFRMGMLGYCWFGISFGYIF